MILSFPIIASRKSTGSRSYSRQPAIRTSKRYSEFLFRQEPKSRHRHADVIASPFSTNGPRTYDRVVLTLYAPYRKLRNINVFQSLLSTIDLGCVLYVRSNGALSRATPRGCTLRTDYRLSSPGSLHSNPVHGLMYSFVRFIQESLMH